MYMFTYIDMYPHPDLLLKGGPLFCCCIGNPSVLKDKTQSSLDSFGFGSTGQAIEARTMIGWM